MINHSECAHEATSSARAKCRRAMRNGDESPKTTKSPRSPKADNDRNTGTTPRDKDKQCMICGVERIDRKGTPPLEKYMLYVGPKCGYYLADATDISPVD